MLRVYIAGPFTAGDQFQNVARALRAGDEAIELGCAPFVPHIYCLCHMLAEHDYETWMAIDRAWLLASDAVYRIPGNSPGADREAATAQEMGIPVFFDSKSLAEWARNRDAA